MVKMTVQSTRKQFRLRPHRMKRHERPDRVVGDSPRRLTGARLGCHLNSILDNFSRRESCPVKGRMLRHSRIHFPHDLDQLLVAGPHRAAVRELTKKRIPCGTFSNRVRLWRAVQDDDDANNASLKPVVLRGLS